MEGVGAYETNAAWVAIISLACDALHMTSDAAHHPVGQYMSDDAGCVQRTVPDLSLVHAIDETACLLARSWRARRVIISTLLSS
jgi:hypothetical protein